jgi:hypothetical protein
MATEQKDRNAVIADLVREGKLTFQAIGNRYNLTRARIRQIAIEQGVRWSPGRLVLKLSEAKIYEAYGMIERGMPIAHAAHAVEAMVVASTLRRALQVRGLHEPEHDDRAWADVEIAFLRQHYKTPGWSASKIGAKLGRTRNEVIGKANRLKLCRPLDPSETVSGQVRALLSADGTLTPKQIAGQLGCPLARARHEKWRFKNPELDYRGQHLRNARKRQGAQQISARAA